MSQKTVAGTMESLGAASEKEMDREGLALVTEIGSTILSSRSCSVSSVSCGSTCHDQKMCPQDISVGNREVR